MRSYFFPAGLVVALRNVALFREIFWVSFLFCWRELVLEHFIAIFLKPSFPFVQKTHFSSV